ncbi:membrane protein [Gordonia phage Sidious]|uniref:Membrane protein n=1 Tax=Gordonia phage Sidious TaxID=2591118 RepID=A0A515MI80_9CAUD|nr:membrane protein [Gordonia phage Sidious]QDM56371.1 membrane protein [Gordonia phage Sidious]
MPLRRIRHDSRHPFEIAMVAWMLFYSLVALLFDRFPGAINTGGGDAFKWFWGGMLLVGTVLATAGIGLDLVRAGLMRRRPARAQDWLNDSTGLTLESAGMFFCSGALLVYGSTILDEFKSTNILAGGTFIVFGLASLARAIIIRRDLRRVARGDIRP